MGCNITKLGADGDKFQARLRPLLVQGMAEMRRLKLPCHPIKDTPSKKALLLHTPNIDPKKPTGNFYGIKVATKAKKPRDDTNADEDDDDVDVDDEEGRKIGPLPASPSFRIFFQDDAARRTHNQIGNRHASPSPDVGRIETLTDTVSTCDVAPSEKKEGKRRNIGRVMSGKKAGVAVKNLITKKACYYPSTLPADDSRRVAP